MKILAKLLTLFFISFSLVSCEQSKEVQCDKLGQASLESVKLIKNFTDRYTEKYAKNFDKKFTTENIKGGYLTPETLNNLYKYYDSMALQLIQNIDQSMVSLNDLQLTDDYLLFGKNKHIQNANSFKSEVSSYKNYWDTFMNSNELNATDLRKEENKFFDKISLLSDNMSENWLSIQNYCKNK